MASRPKENNSLVVVGAIPRGRPSSYSEEVADEILTRIAAGETLSRICLDEGMPSRRTVTEWLMRDREGFSARYARAREFQADYEFDEMLDISDDSGGDAYVDMEGRARIDGEAIQRAKLRIETRRWRAERLNRRVYGAKVEHEIHADSAASLDQAELPRGLQFLAGRFSESEGRSE